jgi:hypothetical protein
VLVRQIHLWYVVFCLALKITSAQVFVEDFVNCRTTTNHWIF